MFRICISNKCFFNLKLEEKKKRLSVKDIGLSYRIRKKPNQDTRELSLTTSIEQN